MIPKEIEILKISSSVKKLSVENSQTGPADVQNCIPSMFQILQYLFESGISMQTVILRLAVKLRIGLITVLKNSRSFSEHEVHY